MKNVSMSLRTETASVTKLTALWALSESGLGGILHALHLPFKGLLIAGIAIIILTVIAKYSGYSFKKIIGATVIVLIVKAMVSPHSPPPAYFAVAFQGLIAAVFFSTFRSKHLAAILTGVTALAETCAQKFIVLTVFFGKNLWEAMNGFLKEVAKELHFDAHHNYAFWFVGLYILLYALWGGIVGNYAAKVPAKIDAEKDNVLAEIKSNSVNKAQIPASSKNRKKRKLRKWLWYAVILLAIIDVFLYFGGGSKKVLAVLLRTGAAVGLVYLIILPLLNFIFSNWLKNRSESQMSKFKEIIGMLPEMRSYLPDAVAIAKKQPGFFKRFTKFLRVMLIMAVYGEKKEDFLN